VNYLPTLTPLIAEPEASHVLLHKGARCWMHKKKEITYADDIMNDQLVANRGSQQTKKGVAY